MFKFNNEVLTIKGQPVMVTRKKKRAMATANKGKINGLETEMLKRGLLETKDDDDLE